MSWKLCFKLRYTQVFSGLPFLCPVLCSRCPIMAVPGWHHSSGMEVCFDSFHFYSPRPLARAHARPCLSPDWMALCQPATTIALICSSFFHCPSPCVYIPIPLSSSNFTYSHSKSFTSLVYTHYYVNTKHHFNEAIYRFFFPEGSAQFASLKCHLEDCFSSWRNDLCDCPVGNYSSSYLFHGDKRRTKRAHEFGECCVVLINFQPPPPSMCASFHVSESLEQVVLVHTHTVRQNDWCDYQ